MQFLNPCNDVAFKKIFYTEPNKHITLSLLNSILEYSDDRAITSIEFMIYDQKKIAKEKKDNILDLACTDQAGNRFIVEIQIERFKSIDRRMVYFGAKTYSMQTSVSDNATIKVQKKQTQHLMPVIVIAILDFIAFPDKDSYKSTHELMDCKTYERDLKDLSFVVIELPKFLKKEDELSSDEDKWLYFLKSINKLDQIPSSFETDELVTACQAAERTTWTSEELSAYDAILLNAADQDSLKLLIEDYETKGKIEGKMEKALEIAKSLLDVLDVPTIAQKTGLNVKDVERLKKSVVR